MDFPRNVHFVKNLWGFLLSKFMSKLHETLNIFSYIFYFYHKEFVKSLVMNQTLWTVPNFEISNFDLYGAFIIPSCRLSSHMTGYAGSRDNLGTPQSPQTIPNIPLKNRLRPSRKSFVWVTCYMLIVRNPHRILARGSESIFQWYIWIGVGSSAETAGFNLPILHSYSFLESLRSPVVCG